MDPRRHKVLVVLILTITMHYIMIEVVVVEHILLAFYYFMVDVLKVAMV